MKDKSYKTSLTTVTSRFFSHQLLIDTELKSYFGNMKNSKVKMSETRVGADGQFNLDGILSELGSFGRYQVLLLLLLAFRDTFLAMCNYHYVFTAAEVGHRCYVSACESRDDPYNATWSQHAFANATAACYRLAVDQALGANASTARAQWNASECSPEVFAADSAAPCERLQYADYNSIVAEFDLGCQPWKRTLLGTVHNLGLVFSSVLSGLISDRYGRKVIIVGTPLVVGGLGLLKSFAVSFWMLIVLEFLETALGYGTASMVLSLETVSQSNRVVFSCIWDILSSFGGAFFGLIAWKVPYWRHTMRAIYAPLLVVVFYIFLVDEGVRWLLAHDRKDEAVRVLNKVAKINNITLSNKAQKMLMQITDKRHVDDQMDSEPKHESQHLLSVLRSRTILFRVAVIAACFICGTFVYTATIINSTNISGNKYINYSALQLVSIPTRIITALTLTRFGRKTPICVAYCLCAVFFISSAFVPKSVWWTSMLFYLVGKMCSSYGLFSVHVVAMEVFPTTSRNSLTNIASTVGRLGAVLAPQAPLLEWYMPGLPSVVFGVAALVPAVLALLLPDTSGVALPERVRDAERLTPTGNCARADTAPTAPPPEGKRPETV